MKRITLLAMLMTMLWATVAQSGWLLYYKSSFSGYVFDAESKKPIDNVLVVVSYYQSFISPAGAITVSFDAKEVVTDRNGMFKFPLYMNAISPLSTTSYAEFTFFKPKYYSICGRRIEDHFSSNISFEEYLYPEVYGDITTIRIINNNIFLPLISDKDRPNNLCLDRALPSHGRPLDKMWDGLPLTKEYYLKEVKEIAIINRRQNYYKEVEVDLIEIPKMVANYNNMYAYYIAKNKDQKTLAILIRMQQNLLGRYNEFIEKEKYVAKSENRPERVLNLNMVGNVP